MSNKLDRVIIVTGGTGGHIFPARSTAEAAVSEGFKVTVFSDKNYPKYIQDSDSYGYKVINSSQIKKSPLFLIKAFFKILLGIVKSFFLIAYYRPKAVIAFGGYATFPTLISAIILHRKIILHEQNAHLGKVNRIFGKYAQIIALSYEKTDGISQTYANKTKYVGNPIREEIKNLSKSEYKLPDLSVKKADNLGYDVLLASQFKKSVIDESKLFNILVIGGSGGAKIFSDILPKAFFNLRNEIKNHLIINQQCRKEYFSNTYDQYKSFNLNVTLKPFFHDMEKYIKSAHLVIARSGSSSISELTAAKKPLILIPYKFASDNHQEKNARFIEKKGGAIVIKEQDFTIRNITQTIEGLIDNPDILYTMSQHSFDCASLKADINLVKLI